MKKLVAAITAVIFAVALVLVGAAAPASAHTATLSAAVACNNSAGTAVVTWTIDNDYSEQLNVTASDNPSIPLGTTVAATGGSGSPDTVKTFTESIGAPAAGKTASATVSFRWDGDNVTQLNTARSATVPSTCGVTPTSTSTPTPILTSTPTPTPTPTSTPTVATASVTFADGICGTPGTYKATHSATFATFEGSTPVISADGMTWSWVVDAASGHQFADGSTTETLTGTVPDAIPYQNTDHSAPCYQEPPADATASVTFSGATCTEYSSTPNALIQNAIWTRQNVDVVAGTYDWVAIADSGHEFAVGQSRLELKGTLPAPLPSQSTNPNGSCYTAPPADASATVTVTQPTCDAPSMLVYGAHVNSTFDAVNSTANGTTGATASSYTVYANADSGHAFNPAGAGTGESFNADATDQPANTIETFTGSLAPQLPSQSTNQSAPCYNAPPIALTDPTASVCTQSTQTALTSWVNIELESNVVYNVYPIGHPEQSTVLNAGYTAEPAGVYTIVATAEPGYTLAATATQPAGLTHTWTVTAADSLSPECISLPVGATWHAGATASSAVCTSGDIQLGTITLEHLASEKGRVLYTVTNHATHAVVYHGSARSSVSVAPGTYDVSATAVNPADGISGPDSFDGLVVDAAGIGCSSLSTLAFTGSSATVGGFLAGGLLFLGIAGLFMRRRFGRRAH